jgi:hypothetical protein
MDCFAKLALTKIIGPQAHERKARAAGARTPDLIRGKE